jgi:ATP-dependent RNA helicase DeaD
MVAIYGGASITDQAREIEKRGTNYCGDSRKNARHDQQRIGKYLSNCFCILDEADEMLNMGFYEDIVNILSTTPDEKNTWLFSATMPAEE